MLDDAKMGMKQLSSLGRIALSLIHEMINTFAKFYWHMLSCELRIFKNTELEEAKKWIPNNNKSIMNTNSDNPKATGIEARIQGK